MIHRCCVDRFLRFFFLCFSRRRHVGARNVQKSCDVSSYKFLETKNHTEKLVFQFTFKLMCNEIAGCCHNKYLLKTHVHETQLFGFSVPFIKSRSITKLVWKNLEHPVLSIINTFIVAVSVTLFSWKAI